VAVLLSCGVAAIHLLPAVQLLPEISRSSELAPELYKLGSLPLRHFFTLVNPDLFGRISPQWNYFGSAYFWTLAFYTPLLLLPLAFLSSCDPAGRRHRIFFLALIPSTHQPIRNGNSYGVMGSFITFSPRSALNKSTNVGNYTDLNNATMAQQTPEENTNFSHTAVCKAIANMTAVGQQGSAPQKDHRVRIASQKELGAGEAVDTAVAEKEVAAEMRYFLRGSQAGAGEAELRSCATNAQRMDAAATEEEAAAEANRFLRGSRKMIQIGGLKSGPKNLKLNSRFAFW
jgi:hypothetical protein